MLPEVNARRTYGEPSRSGQSGRFVLVGFAVVVLVAAVIGITALLSRPSGASPAGGTATTTTPTSTPTVTQSPTAAPRPTATPTASPSRPTSGTAVIASVTTYDPSGGTEHEELVARIWDGDPTTAWTTRTYTKPRFGQLKDGVALVVTLKEPATVSTVTITAPQTGGLVEIRQTDPATKAGGNVLVSGPVSSGPTTTFTLKDPQRMDSFVVWLAELPQTPNGYVLEISELEVR